MHDPVLEDTREFDEPNESLREGERLLREGQGMALYKVALADGVLKHRFIQLCTTASAKLQSMCGNCLVAFAGSHEAALMISEEPEGASRRK
jgi:hypothetical protein